MLETQINIYSVDTGNFYSNHEAKLHWLNHRLKSERNQLIDGKIVKTKDGRVKKTIVGLKEAESKLIERGIEKKKLDSDYEDEIDWSEFGDDRDALLALYQYYKTIKNLVELKNRKIKETKDTLLTLLSNKVRANIKSDGKHHIRTLNENQVSNKNIISVFDSSFTRMIGAKKDELCEDFMVVQVYYFDVIKDLIYHGFTYKGEKYIYFTSSAGQIRTKKTVFVKESVWKKYEKTIMCGLTIDDINKKGGNNPNKHLAYMALANSATDVWNEFNIDKTIVVDDFETNVFGTYDLVDDVDYSIKRMSGYVPIPHTDGAGMMLPRMGKNRMVRLPWVKGLLGVFDFRKFIEVNNCSPIITDIYGQEHNIIEEDIEIVLTKSQFKMYKYYDSWESYKYLYKKYNCSAGYTNLEEDRIKNATINYQMLQTLTDITDDEIREIAQPSIDKLNSLTSSVDNIKSAFGINPYNTNKTSFQKAIELYPDLLNDEYVKSELREIKDSMVAKFKSGKLKVYGKYTFLLPDFYAACEYWFLHEKNPKGLLDDGEVFCWLFRKSDKLDCLRSPHLYKEHAIRKNIACRTYTERQQKVREWFVSDGVYTSCHDLISKILQFDVDGDKSLVIADESIVRIAEKNMKDVVPLYYNMKKASPVILNNASIYDGLNAAFTGSNIGQYSNNISKIWNSDVFVSGTNEEKKEAIDTVKLLCMENNFVIDRAKTLYMPERPDFVKKLVTKFTKVNVPYFFKYAKDKEDFQVAEINNSFVNKLSTIIPNPRINCRKLGLKTIDYRLLMKNPKINFNIEFTDNGKLVKENTDPMIVKYYELNQKYHFKIDTECVNTIKGDMLTNTQAKQDIFFKVITEEIKTELLKYGRSEDEIADILVKILYHIKPNKHKNILWLCYGDYILFNLQNNFRISTKEIQCVDCGEWFYVDIMDSRTCRCSKCREEYRRIYFRETKRKQRAAKKVIETNSL